MAGGVEYFALLGGGGVCGGGFGCGVCGGGAAVGVDARADVLPFMVSPVCVSAGVLLLYPQWTASLPLLLAMYALLAYPFVAKDVLSAWDALPPDYGRAAAGLGANGFQTACRITFPS